MGAKTGLLAYAAGSVADALRDRPAGTGGGESAEALVRRLHPGWQVEPEADDRANLGDSVYPPEDVAYAACFPGVDICTQAVMVDYPSRLPKRYLNAADGRTVVLHAMHSVVDWLAFAIWRDGVLVRSLSVSPEHGVMEDIGERLPFEAPYWAGEHPVESAWEDDEDEDPYPLPFHPLELGEDALRALFGFIVEGRRMPDDIDADDVPVHRFRLTDPDGPTPEQRKAVREALVARMKPPRIFHMQGGRLVETDMP
ncbi:hypothetical protein [Embleya sp. NPDC005971]|uniref:DUF6928 family protein n=1 Tax=Embleya sp. NPDC005971 TaxID=3156724 RepID=UPI0034051767